MIKLKMVLGLLFLVFSTLLMAQGRVYKVEVSFIPANIDAFLATRDKVARTPEGGVAMLLAALKLYESNREEGFKALISIMDMSILRKQSGEKSYKGYALGGSYSYMLESVISRFPYFASSYFPGTSPENSYKMGRGPFEMEFTPHRHRPQNEQEHTLFVPCSGADSPRPVHVRKNDKGIWKAANYSSLLVGIKPAASAGPKDDL